MIIALCFHYTGMADNDQRREFLEEIQLMKAVGSHKNIVNMVGCCTVEEPMFLLTEYIPYGDLLHYLRKRRGKVTNTNLIKSVFDCCSDHSTQCFESASYASSLQAYPFGVTSVQFSYAAVASFKLYFHISSSLFFFFSKF